MKSFSLVLFLFTGLYQSQSDIIYWSENTILQWSDFKGPHYSINPSELERRYAALTYTDMYFNTETRGDTLIVTAKSRFDRSRSSVQWNAKFDFVLAHERLHFDIREVFCRKTKQAIAEHGPFNRETAKKDLKKITSEIQNLYIRQQNGFDRASYRLERVQDDWILKISGELKALDAYKAPEIKVLLVD
jgi:hypothetical protein